MSLSTKIVPVTFWPDQADTLELIPANFLPPPCYVYRLKNQTGTIFKSESVKMSQDNWAAWPANADDTEYQLNAITSQLGLVRA